MMKRVVIGWVLVALAGSPVLADKLSDDDFKQLKKSIQRYANAGKHIELAKSIEKISKDDSKRVVDLLLATAVGIPNAR